MKESEIEWMMKSGVLVCLSSSVVSSSALRFIEGILCTKKYNLFVAQAEHNTVNTDTNACN